MLSCKLKSYDVRIEDTRRTFRARLLLRSCLPDSAQMPHSEAREMEVVAETSDSGTIKDGNTSRDEPVAEWYKNADSYPRVN